MTSSAKKGRTTSEKREENVKFDPFSVCVQEVLTAIHLLSCQEEKVIMGALVSLDHYAAKSPYSVEFLLENGLHPERLLLMAFKEDTLPASSQARVFAAKLLARFVKIPRVRGSLVDEGTELCLRCLERNESEVMNEYSSLVLAELTTGSSVSYAAALLLSPFARQLNPLKVLFARLHSSKDPDVLFNCLRNIWQLLIAASAVSDSRQYTDVIDDEGIMSVIPPLFKTNYPAIQIMSLAVAYEATILSPIAHGILSSTLGTLLELLEAPSDRLLHCTALALIRRLVLPPAAESREGTTPQKDSAIGFVSIDGPKRLFEFLKLYEMEPGDVRFWSMAAILALYTSPSAADILIDQRQHHKEIPALIKDEDSSIAVAAASALSSIRHRANIVGEVLGSSAAARYLAALAARWPGDEAVEPRQRQTMEGCAVAAAVLRSLVLENLQARRTLILEPQETSTTRQHSKTDFRGSARKSSAPRVADAVDNLREILERVGKVPDDCITSVLSIVTTLASSEDLRSLLSSNQGLVVAVTNCLQAFPYIPPDPPVVELPAPWPETSQALERMVAARLTRGRMWVPRNPAPGQARPLAEVRESACLALGVLLLDTAAAETFVANHGPQMIRHILEKEERGFGRNSLIEAALSFIIQCPSIVANALVANGTLGWMLSEAAASRHIPLIAQWHACVASLLRSHPSAKFQVTSRLNPEDSTGDLFYVVCPAPGRYEALPSLEELMGRPPTPHTHVFAASFVPTPPPPCGPSLSPQTAPGGRRSKRMSRAQTPPPPPRTETPAVEPDENLREFERALREVFRGSDVGMRSMIETVARLVWEMMAGPVKDGGFKKERHLEELKLESGSGDVIQLGKVRMGGHTERAILFKVLADRLGLPVALVRGPYGRCWVEVALVEAVVGKEVEVVELYNMDEGASPPPVESPSARSSRASRPRNSNSGRSTISERSRRSQERAKENSLQHGTRETSRSSAPSYVPQAILNVPARIIKPNHVIDLVSPECRLYPIGSHEADEYCGFAACEFDVGIVPPRHSSCDSTEREEEVRKFEEELYLAIR